MKISRLIELIVRLDEFDRLSFAGRQDDSGIRAKGVNRQPYKRIKNFPYDRDVSYGQPAKYDRGSTNAGTLSGPIVPKDYEKFSLGIMGKKDEVDEAMGDPSFVSKGNSSNRGSSVPGSGGSWASNPPKEWDENDELDEAPLMIDTSPPDVEVVPNSKAPDFRDQTDDDLENKLNRIWGDDDNMNLVDPNIFGTADAHVLAPDPFSVVNSRLSSRGLYGLMPKESAWDRVSGVSNKRNR